MKTALIHHPIFQKHDTGIGHPETPRRYEVVMKALKADENFWLSLTEITPEKAAKGLIQAAHTPLHYKKIEAAFGEGVEYLDADTIVSMHSFEAALYGAGGACRAVDAVMKGEARNAFVASRPPGHHATAERAMGFCLFNNVAVAARYAQNKYKEIERVAIVDWDVHHGNGTQGIFFDDPTVFFFSQHQYPWYPGTGSRGETGFGRGKGYTLNSPVKARTKASHLTDPLGQLLLDDDDFASMTKTVLNWADEVCGGRVVSCLEGGYNLDTLGESVKNHVLELSRR
jgi:acetoin utilization deacetylase AcuC-like enzyme